MGSVYEVYLSADVYESIKKHLPKIWSSDVNPIFSRVHFLQASTYGLSSNSFRFGSVTVMPNAELDFYNPESLTQSLKLNVSDKFHVFPGGVVRGQSVDVHARNITIEVVGSIIAKSSGFTFGAGEGIVDINVKCMLKPVFRLVPISPQQK